MSDPQKITIPQGRTPTPTSVRPLNPNVKQWAASNPQQNVWVTASAGTGKTKVLTDRVLRLLLPRIDGGPATPTHRILCLTYTKAAAGEMTLRINETLGEWATMPPDNLKESLKRLSGEDPTSDMLEAARKLFSQVIDTPGGLKIMTIHAFCQYVLGRFPLEAGISPHMQVIEESQAKAMMSAALLKRVQEAAYQRLSIEMAPDTLYARLQECMQNYAPIEQLFQEEQGDEAVRSALAKDLNAPLKDKETLYQEFIRTLDVSSLNQFAEALKHGSPTDQGRGDTLKNWLSLSERDKRTHFNLLKETFLTTKDEPRQRVTKGTLSFDPGSEEFQAFFAAEILNLEEDLKSVDLVQFTYDLLSLARDVHDDYSRQKEALGLLDYDDLLQKTLTLLKRAESGTSWVLYKLDGGLDHIMLDEAQDTNPVQWQIISLLVNEFYQNAATTDLTRTLFVVGDEKQSIYRFQGASLEDFQYMQDFLKTKAENVHLPWHSESLQISFRSTRSILGFVDAAFTDAKMRRDIGLPDHSPLEHFSWRSRQAGRVELWPLIEAPEAEMRTPWQPPTQIRHIKTAKALLAEKIAEKIAADLSNKRLLRSKNRPVRTGDILILVRRRNSFIDLLVRELKTRYIPVSGADRLVLNDYIAVQDFVSLAKFAIQTRDDLSLAEILKSPFVGMSDEALEDLAYGRGDKSLWQRLHEKKKTKITEWLEIIIRQRNLRPFDFFLFILNTPCPADHVSGLRAIHQRMGADSVDIIDQFLNSVQTYERSNPADLQSFLVWEHQNKIEIKRDLSGQENCVRIMTVHGAKGLQAPIVIMPDLLRTKSAVTNKLPKLLFPARTGAKTPLFSPRKQLNNKTYSHYLDKIALQETAEYKRLFYVAITRAEDELILCDCAGKSASDEESWYTYAAAAFEELGDEIEEEEGGVRVYAHPQIGDPEEDKYNANLTEASSKPLGEWAYHPAPVETLLQKPYRPSRPEEADTYITAPNSQSDSLACFRRGNLIHSLLQFLPGLPNEKRHVAGNAFLKKTAKDLESAARTEILNETLAVINMPAFSELFSQRATAEVPVSGLLPSGKLISGQIDRLIIRERDVVILDYKTNRPPPTDESDVPTLYKSQMRAYKEALQEIYPNKTITCALLWTYGPRLMILNEL